MNAIKKNALSELEKSIRADYDQAIKEQVENVITLLERKNQEYLDGKYDNIEDAKKDAADIVRELRYGEAGYFWIDTSEGVNVVLLGGDKEGTNRLDTVDCNGTPMVQIFIDGAVKEGDFYSDYYFFKEGATEYSPKRAYTKYWCLYLLQLIFQSLFL